MEASEHLQHGSTRTTHKRQQTIRRHGQTCERATGSRSLTAHHVHRASGRHTSTHTHTQSLSLSLSLSLSRSRSHTHTQKTHTKLDNGHRAPGSRQCTSCSDELRRRSAVSAGWVCGSLVAACCMRCTLCGMYRRVRKTRRDCRASPARTSTMHVLLCVCWCARVVRRTSARHSTRPGEPK